MKKFIVCIIAIIILILLVAISKGIKTTKYSHSDIVDLINKGTQSMDNVSFDKEGYKYTYTYYFKGNKWKMASSSNHVFITLEDGKTYAIDHNNKIIDITNNTTIIKKGLQYDSLLVERLNEKNEYKGSFRYELAYIRDEKIDNKDCIFVKECVFDIDSEEYLNRSYNYKDEVSVYWIEKSTGFVIGTATMEIGKDKATPQTIIKNIKFGEISDDIFNDMFTLPNDYNIIDFTKNRK